MKFSIIHVTDSQIRGTNPKGRIDDFPSALKEKFREIFALAQSIKDAGQVFEEVVIVHSGDMFDAPDISDSIAGEFAELLLESPAPIYVVPGNHDEFVHNLETVYRTKLGLLGRVKVLHVLGREPVVFRNKGMFTVQLTGQGYHPDIDATGMDYMAPEPTINKSDIGGTWVVHAVHGSLTSEPIFGPHTLIKDCKTNAHVVLTGHLHNGYGLVRRINMTQIDNTHIYQSNQTVDMIKLDQEVQLFCNPGALARVDATPEDMLRSVQVAVIEFTESEVSATLVPLKCARPGSEVLSREHIVKQTEREENMKKFMALLNQEGEMKFLSVQEIVKDIAGRKALPKELVIDVLRRIARAREELGRKAG